ncbi:MAG: VOC family protein, partial [Acidimicrobiales bacterium]
MNTELELAYLGVEVADPAAFGTFLGDVVGLTPGDKTSDGGETWRNDDRAQRIIVHAGPANDAVFIGFECASPAAFERAVERARAAGVTVTEGSADDLEARRVQGLARFETPWGVPVELVHGLAASPEPFASSLVPGGFLTKDQGFGHVVFVTPDLDKADRFARDVLGLTQSDWMETDLGGMALTVRFYH